MWNDRDASSYSMIGNHTNGLVINFRPVIHVLTMPEDESNLEAYAAAVLIHETLHTLQISDVTNHSEASNCVMHYGGYTYLNGLYLRYRNGQTFLLCESCQNLVNGFFNTTMFIDGN